MRKIFILILLLTLLITAKASIQEEFLLREVIPKKLTMPSTENLNYFFEINSKLTVEAYKNNIWDEKKVKKIKDKNLNGEIIYHYSNKKLGKIIKKVITDKEEILEIYFLKEKKPFLVIKKTINLEELKNFDKKLVKELQEEPIFSSRYLFEDNKLIHIFESGDCGAPWHEEYLIDKEKNIRNRLKQLLEKE